MIRKEVGPGRLSVGQVWQERCSGPRWSSRNRRSDASTRAQSLRRDGGGAAERFKPKRYVRAPDAARPHPEADGVRRECPEFAAPPRMTGLSAPRFGEARALLGTARPRRCLTAAAVRGWAGTLRCRGTPATAGAAGGAGRTRSHECCPSVGAAVRPTAAAVGAESHRTAGSSRCSAGTQASTSTTRPPSSTAYTTRPNHSPPRCAHSASRPCHRPWSPGRPLTLQCRAPAARSRPTPDHADRSASVRPSRLDVIPPTTAPACQLSNTRSHKNRSNGYALAAIDKFYRSIGVGRPEVAREELARVAPRALAKADQRRFLRAVEGCPSARDRAIATVFFYTGLRLSELAALEVGDLSVSARRGRLRGSLGEGRRRPGRCPSAAFAATPSTSGPPQGRTRWPPGPRPAVRRRRVPPCGCRGRRVASAPAALVPVSYTHLTL